MPSTSATGKGPDSGPWVLVTGASSGIGYETARAFLQRGNRVIGVARSLQRLKTLAPDRNDDTWLPIAADLTRPDEAEAMVRRVLEATGGPSVIVANAGVGLDARFTETSDEDLRHVFEVNVFGLVRSVRPFVAGMVQRGAGRILLVSSIVGKRGIPHYSAYSASKFALHGMADALRCELWGTGVSVGLICPGTTDTGFRERVRRRGPSQRKIRPPAMTAQTVARVIVKMADSRRRERILPFNARLLALADVLAPGLVDRFLARLLSRREDS